jgi:5'-nucleotidase
VVCAGRLQLDPHLVQPVSSATMSPRSDPTKNWQAPLVIALSSRALFDLVEADRLFWKRGLASFRNYQRRRESSPMQPGPVMALARRLVGLNELSGRRLVELVVVSRNDPDAGTRVLNAAADMDLGIERAAFTGGRDPWPYLRAFGCHLFLSAEPTAVQGAVESGIPAALVLASPSPAPSVHEAHEVRIAFDGDAVLFDDESDRVHEQYGKEAFLEHERRNATTPMKAGPFRSFLEALIGLQHQFDPESNPVRTALVTARSAPAHRRVLNTLRQWGLLIDEAYFLGGQDKTAVLRVLAPDIYFDDRLVNVERAARAATAAHVMHPNSQLTLELAREAPETQGPVVVKAVRRAQQPAQKSASSAGQRRRSLTDVPLARNVRQ